jgi:hypothetical protein
VSTRTALMNARDLISSVLSTLPPDATTVRPGESIQAAIRAAAIDDTIALIDGDYTENVVIDKPLTIVGPPTARLLPANPFEPPLQVVANRVTTRGFTVEIVRADREAVVVGRLEETNADLQPHEVLLEALQVQASAAGGHRGIALHGSNLQVLGCAVKGFWKTDQDTQAVWIHNGPGPYLVADSVLEASGENILLGGSRINIPNCVPTDVVIKGNTIAKPDAWRTNGALVKCSVEVKNGRQVRIEGNTIDGNWLSGQIGTPILLTVRNQYGDNPWAVVDDVDVVRNITRRCTQGFAVSILGSDNEHPSQQTLTVRIVGNLFTDSPSGIIVGNGVASELVIDHNTMPAIAGTNSKFLTFYDSRSSRVISPLQFTNNVVRSGDYGIQSAEFGLGLLTLNGYSTLRSFVGNVIEQSAREAINYRPDLYPNEIVAAGQLLARLDPATFTLLSGTAGY